MNLMLYRLILGLWKKNEKIKFFKFKLFIRWIKMKKYLYFNCKYIIINYTLNLLKVKMNTTYL